MTIQQLRYIVTLDQERHFARAAELCSVTQPGLTIQLKNLEEEIGIKIFDRSRVPLTPTAIGEEIIVKARKVLREIDSIQNLVVTKKNDLQGILRIGIIRTLSPYLVPLFIRQLEQALPKMKFVIKEASTGELIHHLETGLMDVALMATPTGSTYLKEFPVFHEPFVAYLHPGHPGLKEKYYRLREQDKFELLLLQEEYCYNAQLLDICDKNKKKINDTFSYDINSIEMLKNMVRASIGFAIVPWLSVMSELQDGYCRSFKEPIPVREISLVVSDSFSRKLVLEKISEAIWECLPDALKTDKKYKRIKWNDSPYFLKMIQ
ncbi:MAG: hydrogen peroxide-inducible genes activator [Azospira oryzae]|jgi:LysR family hydrogen peroxide-inducible transcriptional activator|nr:MAG: hydrogen peroxide-inducible genes activator [Azospira oryzae]